MIDTKGLTPIAIGCTQGSGSRVLRDILNAAAQIRMDPDVDPVTKDSVGSQRFIRAKDNSKEALQRLTEEFMGEIIDGIPSEQLSEFRYFGWKNPANIRFIDLIFRDQPSVSLHSPLARSSSARPRKTPDQAVSGRVSEQDSSARDEPEAGLAAALGG